MRYRHEFGHVEAQRGLLLSKKATQDIIDRSLDKRKGVLSPETLSHRFQQGWQHLPDGPENILNNNNKNTSCKDNLNLSNNNNNIDDVILASSPASHDFFDEEPNRSKSCADSEESGSSSDEEDSSLSFSDTSPLLDVSSLDSSTSSSSSSSSNASEDTDMSDDDNFDDNDDDLGNNNEENIDDKDQPMDTSWMSFSSVTSSTDSSVPKSPVSVNARRQYPSKRNGIVLPDVLPVGIPKDDDRAGSDDLELQLRRRDLQLDAAPKLSGECCIVEITTQPDIQVDIRLNPTSKRPFSDPYMKHRNTYPRDSKNYNFYFKAADVESTAAKTVQKNARSSVSPRYFALGEGVRLNNFTIVNGLKALSLTELVKEDKESDNTILNRGKKTNAADGIAIEASTQTKSSQTEDEPLVERNAFQANSFTSYNKDNRRRHSDLLSLDQRPCIDASKSFHSNTFEKSKNVGAYDIHSQNVKSVPAELSSKPIQRSATTLSNHCTGASPRSQHKVTTQPMKANDRKQPQHLQQQLPKKGNENKSPELFEVYTMETAIPHINWSAVARSNRESEWMRQRQKDREEIRRKLAMDSDNEDCVAEKMNQGQEATSFDRLRSGNNLQICFLNEAAKETEVLDTSQNVVEPAPEKLQKIPRILKRNLLFPPNLPKCISNSSKVQNNNNDNNNSPQPRVVKRQRPTFFFNRPRSWHAAKVEEKPDLEEDLFTRHRRLQAEAREALSQAKEMARMQMEIERQKKKKSPIADIVGITFPEGSNLLSRHALLDMNVAQLQVIVNDLHSQIETLNEDLVKFLLERDDLHMEQDSMLVDIEDLTRYLGLKGNCSITHSDSKIATNFQGSAPEK